MKTRPPTVDVVLLSWNRLEETLAAVDSVLTQDIESIALWIVDQGSEPRQIAALRRLSRQHPDIHFIELHRNLGVPSGRNVGIGAGKADFVVCLDNDAVFDTPHALSTAVDRLVSDHRLGAISFRALDEATGELDLGSWAYPRILMETSEPVLVGRFVGVGHALRREAFEDAGGYDETLFFCEEELDLSYRMIDLGYRILYDPSIVVSHKQSPEERMEWDGGRMYHQVRNAVLVHHRYRRRLPTTALVAAGWLIRGLYNGQGRQAIHGIFDAIRLLNSEGNAGRLSRQALLYVWEHDTRLRGSLLDRLRHEVLAPLPARMDGRAGSS